MRVGGALILLFQALFVSAQFSMEAFMAASVDDAELLEVKNSLTYLEKHRFNSPWIREIDVRLRSNDTEPDLEDYRMRFGLINPFEIKANAEYHRALGSQLAAERDVKKSDVIRQRYFLLIENIDLNAMRVLVSERLAALRNVEGLLRENLGPSELSDWIDMQADITKTELMAREVAQKLKVNEFLIRERLSDLDTISLDTALLVQEIQIFQLMGELQREDSSGLMTALNAQRSALRASTLALERAESRSNIGYIQAEYDKTRGNNLNSHAGFQVGIALPLVNPKKPDYQREVLKQLEQEAEDQLEATIQSRQQQVETLKFDYTQENLAFYKQKLEALKPIASSMNTPKLYLDYLKYAQFLEENYLRQKSELMRSFINLLHEKGVFLEGPQVNYLSRNFTAY